MGKKIELKEGEVYLPKRDATRDSHRRIVGIVGEAIVFSTGGERNYSCKRQSFISWRGKRVNEGAT